MTACMSCHLCHSQEDIDLLVHLELLQHIADDTQDPGLMSTRPGRTKVVSSRLIQATNDRVYALQAAQPRPCHRQDDIDLLVHHEFLQHVAGSTRDRGLVGTHPRGTRAVSVKFCLTQVK